MLDCKEMNTLMVTTLKLLNDDSSERIDVTLYIQIIVSLMYLTNIGLDICFVVNTLSQYMVEPRHIHLVAAKHVMRYLKGTLDCGLTYAADSGLRLCGYTDSYWEVSAEDRNIPSGCCFSLGSSVISWISRKHTSVSLNMTEDDYIVTCLACSEAIWIHIF